MIEIELDPQAIAHVAQEDAEMALSMAVNALSEYAVDQIRQKSSEKLSISQWQQFSRAVQVRQDKFSATITLEDPEMQRLERGIDSFDIKRGLLDSPKAKTSITTGAKYIDVPFRHKRLKREKKGRYIEKQSMRAAIKKAQDALHKSGGGKRKMFPRPKQGPVPVTADMVVKTQSIRTFRRVSENSPTNSWLHPGTAGIEVFSEVSKEIDLIKDDVLNDIVEAM